MKKFVLFIAVMALCCGNVFAEEDLSQADSVVESAEAEPELEYPLAVPDMPVYDSETDGFFKNSAFVGDSIMLGYKMYCQSKGEGFLGEPLFLASGSFSLWQSVSPVTEESLHPEYNGEKRLVEEAVAESGSDRVFISLGTNDLGWISPEDCAENYNNLIFRIHTKAPNAKIYIIGLTYMYDSSQKENLNNENMRALNDKMREYAESYDYVKFINIGDRLIDENGGLKPEYTSDNYVHISSEGYDVWTKVLRAYARDFTAEEAAEAEAALQQTA